MNILRSGSESTNRWLFVLYIGFYAGLIWGCFKLVEYYFKFTVIVMGFLVEPFFKHSFLLQWQGILIGLGSFILLSIIASLLYAVLFQRITGTWMGIFYGIIWWCLLYLLIGPFTGMMEQINHYDWNTILSEICLFLLWGLFIGYSIAFEFTDDRARDKQTSTS